MSNYMESNKAPIFGISRHRIGTDGLGVKTLVTFMGCPLKCKYCINDVCHVPLPAEGYGIEWLSPQELYDRVKIDNLYFLATYGGITFGGGEPGLYADYIKEFKSICHKEWRLTLQTSLNYPQKYLEELLPVIDEFIIDIKDMHSDIYKAYTGVDNKLVIQNLRYFKEHCKNKDFTILAPWMPGYTDDWLANPQRLMELGFSFSDIQEKLYTDKNGKKLIQPMVLGGCPVTSDYNPDPSDISMFD